MYSLNNVLHAFVIAVSLSLVVFFFQFNVPWRRPRNRNVLVKQAHTSIAVDRHQSFKIGFCFFCRSTGFILEGFPRTDAEARYLASSGLFPDLAVLLAVEDTDIVDRLLPPLLKKWRTKRDKREAEKQRKRALAQKHKVRTDS